MNNDDIDIEKHHWNRIDISHNVYNPNNIIIDKENYYTIPFGHRCTSALALRFAGLRKFSLPFDWVKPIYPNKIMNIIKIIKLLINWFFNERILLGKKFFNIQSYSTLKIK